MREYKTMADTSDGARSAEYAQTAEAHHNAKIKTMHENIIALERRAEVAEKSARYWWRLATFELVVIAFIVVLPAVVGYVVGRI